MEEKRGRKRGMRERMGDGGGERDGNRAVREGRRSKGDMEEHESEGREVWGAMEPLPCLPPPPLTCTAPIGAVLQRRRIAGKAAVPARLHHAASRA